MSRKPETYHPELLNIIAKDWQGKVIELSWLTILMT
jgi:hypothetical protein